MYRAPLDNAYRRLGARYPRAALALAYPVSVLVVAGGILLLNLYVDVSLDTFWRLLVVSEALVIVEIAAALWLAYRLIRPADPWLRGERTPDTAVAAWSALVGLQVHMLRFGRGLPVPLSTIPISIFVTLELDGTFLSFLAIAAGATVVLAYAVFLRFFITELSMRPVLVEISRDLPDGADLGDLSVPLRAKLLIALPVINVVTGVVVAGLASDDPSLRALGIGVLGAIGVAFTISYELSVLLSRSLLAPIQDLREGTERVIAGDLRVRVPVLATDETGRLAGSFNQMVAGLEERERLREAFGAFVDPHLAERVIEEGTVLEGEEAEVTVLFVDIREFTAFAERASAAEVVTELNAFYELVVPVLVRHGGHANKFVGDGLLAVFGAPDHLPDHADRGVAAALEIAAVVSRAYGGRLRIGIGVNSGPVVAGTIGGGGRVEFTVIGDTVNTAARVEALTRETDDTVLITEATRCLLRRDHGGFAERGTVALRGRSEPVRVHVALAAPTAPEYPAPLARRRADARAGAAGCPPARGPR